MTEERIEAAMEHMGNVIEENVDRAANKHGATARYALLLNH